MENKNTEEIKQNTLQERIENEKYTFDTINSFINTADNKISIMLGIHSAIFTVFGAFTTFSFKDYSWKEIDGGMICYLIFMVFSIILFSSSLVFFLFALCPRFKGNNKKDNKEENEVEKKYNLLFFEDIKTLEKHKYIGLAKAKNLQSFNDDLEEEIHANASICSKKMHYFRKGLIASSISMLFYIICFLIMLFI